VWWREVSSLAKRRPAAFRFQTANRYEWRGGKSWRLLRRANNENICAEIIKISVSHRNAEKKSKNITEANGADVIKPAVFMVTGSRETSIRCEMIVMSDGCMPISIEH
jgi:hypothetical protein